MQRPRAAPIPSRHRPRLRIFTCRATTTSSPTPASGSRPKRAPTWWSPSVVVVAAAAAARRDLGWGHKSSGWCGWICRRRHHQRRGHAGWPTIPDLRRQRRHSGRRWIRQRRFRRAGRSWRCLQFSRRCLRRRRHRRTRWTREQQLDRPGAGRRWSLERGRHAGTRLGRSGNRNCRGTIGVLVPVCLAGGRWRRPCGVGPRRQRRRRRRRQRHYCSGRPRRCHDRNIGGNGFNESNFHQWSRWWRRRRWRARRHGRLRRSGSGGLPRHHWAVVLTLLCGGGEIVPVGTEAKSIHRSTSWSTRTSGSRDVCLNCSLELSSGTHEHP